MIQPTNGEIKVLSGELTKYLRRWRDYPLAFVIEAMGAREHGMPSKWQAEVLRDFPKNQKVAIRSGHGVGKSRLLGWLIWWFAVCMKKPGKPMKIPCTGPSGGNLEDVLWGEVQLLYGHLSPFFQEFFTVNSDEMYCIEERKAWFAKLRTSRKEAPDALQGFHGDPSLFVLDESFGIPDEVFEVARGAMSDRHSFAIQTGNPTNLSGYAYNSHKMEGSIWHCRQVSCMDELDTVEQRYPFVHMGGEVEVIKVMGRVSKDYVDSMLREFGERSPTYAARVLGDFPVTETDQVILNEWLAGCWGRERVVVNDKHRIMGVDVAYQGDDDSSLVVRHGPNIEQVESWHGYDPAETTERVESAWKDALKEGRPIRWICVDATGIGAGVAATLRKLGYPVIAVMVAELPPEDGGTKCRAVRDWLWWQSRLFFRGMRPSFAYDTPIFRQLAKELAGPKFTYSSANNRVVVESKKDMRKRGVGSPDVADALNLTFFADYDFRKTSPEFAKNRKTHRRRKGDGESKLWRLA